MKNLMLWLITFILWVPALKAVPLSNYVWDAAAERHGIDIAGQLAWDPNACDFGKADFEAHAFPVFSNKGPSGKPQKNATGAYCLTVQLPPERMATMLHLSMIRIFGTAELWINQQRVWHQNSSTGPRRLNLLHEVTSERLQIELRLRCNEAPSCGFRGSLHIREARQGTRSDLLHYSYDLLAVTGIVACLFYHLIFAFLRRRSSTAIFLSINAIALMMRLVLAGHGQLHYFLDIKETWYWRLETLAVYLLLPSTISLVKTVFEKEAPQYLSTLGWVTAGAASVFLVLEARIFLFLLIIVYVLILFNLINYFITVPRAVRNRRSGAIILVVSAVTTFVSTLFEVLNTRLNIEMHSAVQPMSYLAVMIFQSVLLATRINDAFTLAEQQESEIKILKEKIEVEIRSLDHRILERTAELRTIFQSISTGILWISRNEQNVLCISSEYSDYLRKTVGFDIQAWHEMHFLLRRMRIPDMPRSGREIAVWFEQQMERADDLDRSLERMLGGLRVFDDLDCVKHLKFKWIPIVEDGRVTELFIFVFDVSPSIELQNLAQYKAREIEALRELTGLQPALLEEFHQVFGSPNLPAIRLFARAHQLQHLEQALTTLQNEEQLTQFIQVYRRVLGLLAERQVRARQRTPFDYEQFLQLPDWQKLPVDSRKLFQELVRAREK